MLVSGDTSAHSSSLRPSISEEAEVEAPPPSVRDSRRDSACPWPKEAGGKVPSAEEAVVALKVVSKVPGAEATPRGRVARNGMPSRAGGASSGAWYSRCSSASLSDGGRDSAAAFLEAACPATTELTLPGADRRVAEASGGAGGECVGDAGAVAAAVSAPGADAMWRVRRCCTLAYAEQMMDLFWGGGGKEVVTGDKTGRGRMCQPVKQALVTIPRLGQYSQPLPIGRIQHVLANSSSAEP